MGCRNGRKSGMAENPDMRWRMLRPAGMPAGVLGRPGIAARIPKSAGCRDGKNPEWPKFPICACACLGWPVCPAGPEWRPGYQNRQNVFGHVQTMGMLKQCMCDSRAYENCTGPCNEGGCGRASKQGTVPLQCTCVRTGGRASKEAKQGTVPLRVPLLACPHPYAACTLQNNCCVQRRRLPRRTPSESARKAKVRRRGASKLRNQRNQATKQARDGTACKQGTWG